MVTVDNPKSSFHYFLSLSRSLGFVHDVGFGTWCMYFSAPKTHQIRSEFSSLFSVSLCTGHVVYSGFLLHRELVVVHIVRVAWAASS